MGKTATKVNVFKWYVRKRLVAHGAEIKKNWNMASMDCRRQTELGRDKEDYIATNAGLAVSVGVAVQNSKLPFNR